MEDSVQSQSNNMESASTELQDRAYKMYNMYKVSFDYVWEQIKNYLVKKKFTGL